jgi:hypothetical protein
MEPVILFYAAQDNQIVQTLERQLAEFRVARCRAFSAMESRLRKPNHGLEIVLMVVADLKEMGGIEAIEGLMRDLRLVLVLPDRDAELVSQAHKLAPRFIAYADQGTEQIGAVMKKMTRDCRSKSAMPALALAER